jgi:hypothetical protein
MQALSSTQMLSARTASFAGAARSITLVPDARTVALAAYAQLVGGDAAGARVTLSILMDDSPWREAELWLKRNGSLVGL